MAKKKNVKKKKPAARAAKKSSKKPAKKAAKKTNSKKASSKKKPAAKKKAAAKKSAKAKPSPKKPKAKKAAAKPAAKAKAPAKSSKAAPKLKKTASRASKKKVEPEEEEEVRKPIKLKLPAKEKRMYKELLANLRQQVTNGISFLAGDNLNRSQRDSTGDLSGYSMHMADQGTDNFDREFALNLVSTEQDILFEIDEALQRIELSTYGVCEKSGKLIEKERLKVIPYARYCVEVQSELERGKTRYRPLGPTLSQSG